MNDKERLQKAKSAYLKNRKLSSYEILEKISTNICPLCNSTTQYIGAGEYQCILCKHIITSNYGKIRTFLETNGPSTILEIEQALGIKKEEIKYYLKDSRLEITVNSKTFLQCEICHADIRSGKICDKCATNKNLNNGYALSDIGKSPERMRYLNKRK